MHSKDISLYSQKCVYYIDLFLVLFHLGPLKFKLTKTVKQFLITEVNKKILNVNHY